MNKIDHILIHVKNLEKAIAEFQELGFCVHKGNNKKNCHHAMIYFKDGSFLELIDQNKFPSIFKFLAKKGILNCFGILFRRFTHYSLSKEQFLDFAIFTENIDALYRTSNNKSVSKLMCMKRKNHLNNLIQWKLFAFRDLNLPFVISEYTPTRLPQKNADQHNNEVLGISQIDVDSLNPEIYCKNFDTHFNTKSLHNKIQIGNTIIKVTPSKKHQIAAIKLYSNRIDDKIIKDLEPYNITLVN